MEEPWEITVVMLKRLIDSGTRVNLIDVREQREYDICHINGSRLVPLRQIPKALTELNPSEEYVFYCHTGSRSALAVDHLHRVGFKKVKNLKGGIDEWAATIDHSMPRY